MVAICEHKGYDNDGPFSECTCRKETKCLHTMLHAGFQDLGHSNLKKIRIQGHFPLIFFTQYKE